jgi:cyclic beta-1,2-glucan synthetase
MHSAGMEGILGINREGLMLTIQPCIPSSWAGFEVTVKVENTDYNIVVKQSTNHAEHRIYAVLDDKEIKAVNEIICTPLDGKSHQLTVVIELAH